MDEKEKELSGESAGKFEKDACEDISGADTDAVLEDAEEEAGEKEHESLEEREARIEKLFDELRRVQKTLEERGEEDRRRFIEAINAINASRSSGAVGGSAAEYYSPDEVRKMSAAEVRLRYGAIIESMKKWN